jgi:archaeal type IV pilus assembly protein PilA
MMIQQKPTSNNDLAVSPVVGVMLMLVVTIIIAAVVTGFAGGLIAGQKTAPTLAMDVKIANSGTWIGSGFYAFVSGVSTPIQTSDLKIVTTWTTTNRISNQLMSGGGTSIPGTKNVAFYMGGKINGVTDTEKNGTAPFGIGPGVGNNQSFSAGKVDSNPTDPYQMPAQQFGNYTLVQGTSLFATPAGSKDMSIIGSGFPSPKSASSGTGGYGINLSTFFIYTSAAATNTTNDWSSGQSDSMQGVLGQGWENLKAGDTVNVKVIHVPSGKVIFQKDIAVSEG